MRPYQERYLENTREIAALSRMFPGTENGFEVWLAAQKEANARIARLRAENIVLLNENLFPALDELHTATPEALDDLDAFADQLMDWKTNLDCGVYVAIHEALLRLHRVRRNRDRVIRELYKLGMGLYYLRRMVLGIDDPAADTFAFQNELVFTEASSYIRYFGDIEDEATKGFIIRAFANLALCTRDHKRRIATSARTLQILRDDYYREQAPGLPWNAFLRATHQQMSSNRSELSQGDLTREELAAVLDSCYEVFKPEDGAKNPSVRWLWPYYEMEYNCGYVSLETTLERMEKLIRQTPDDQYDMSGFYGCVQLSIYYGRLLKANPSQQKDIRRVRFLEAAYRKMLNMLFSCPSELYDDYFFYNIDLVISDYFEIEGVPSYRSITTRLIQRFSREQYIRGRKAGEMLRCICATILQTEPRFFDDIPFLREAGTFEAKRDALLAYAEACGLYYDFGLIKMNVGRILQTRNLFENEYQMYCLHTLSGAEDLAKRRSTAELADIARGHHRWYDGSGGYPDGYLRTDSPYRQMTDAVAIVSYLIEEAAEGFDAAIRTINAEARRRFSPLIAAYLDDPQLQDQLKAVLNGDGRRYYQDIYQELRSTGDD